MKKHLTDSCFNEMNGYLLEDIKIANIFFFFFSLLIMFTILLMSEDSLYKLMSRLLIFVENFMTVVCSNLFACSRRWGWLCGLGPLHSCWTSKWIFCFSLLDSSHSLTDWYVLHEKFKMIASKFISHFSFLNWVEIFYTCNFVSNITITT